MSETKKSKKLRIYKYASEFNLSTESIMELLTEKGYKIKSHMSILSDEMLAEIQGHFKKDIEKAEKHYRKISEFQKKHGEKTEEDDSNEEAETEESADTEVEDEEIENEEIETEDVVVESETTETENVEEEIIEDIQAEQDEEVVAESSTDEVEEKVEKVEAEEDVPEVVDSEQEKVVEEKTESENKIFETKSGIEAKNRKKGLTILGKMDLAEKSKSRKSKSKKSDIREVEKSGKGEAGSKDEKKHEKAKVNDTESSAKKKKKKVLKSRKKEGEDTGEKVGKKKRKIKRQTVDKKEVDKAIKRTLLSMDDSNHGERATARKKKRKEKHEQLEKIEEEKAIENKILKVTEYIAVNELANLMDMPISDVISKCLAMGLMVSINQRLDLDTITMVADEFGFEVELQEEYAAEALVDIEDSPESLIERSPVVTIMGHVDHGKTSLLDYIRRENVVAGESGGITQHIGAYKVLVGDNNKAICFLDTPGHEAFTAMRARGAKVTDLVVLIVAADDAVMPQTLEAINHSQAANVPIIIAINKVDKPNANIEKIKQQLADRNVLIEEWGGKYQCVEVSAKTGNNVDLLLEKILLEAEILELKANPDRHARGAVIESQLDKGRGITATILVEKGTLNIGDPFVAGNVHGRVRAMFDERNKKVTIAGPATPVLVLGFEEAPQAGDSFVVVQSEKEAREVSIKRQQLKREQDRRQVKLITLDEIANQINKGERKELPLVVKGDVDGSVEALADSLMKLSNDEVMVRVIHRGVGAISEGDVLLAAASGAIIVGFHVRPHINARKLAENESVDIRIYNVIYDAINEVKSALEGMLSPVISEEMVATVEVRDIFKVPKAGTIAGCYVQDGKVIRTNKVRLFRDGISIFEGSLSSLKRFKDDVKEVDAGYECGIGITNFNDIKIGDIIESYKIVETKKKLEL